MDHFVPTDKLYLFSCDENGVDGGRGGWVVAGWWGGGGGRGGEEKGDNDSIITCRVQATSTGSVNAK